MDRIILINPEFPESELISKATDIIKQGGVVAFPTIGLYGLGADALDPEAGNKIFHIKKRPFNKPILLVIDKTTDWKRLVVSVPDSARKLIKAFWPGKITLIFKASNLVPENFTAGTGKIGIRMTVHPVASSLVRAVGGPITGTSANISGRPGCKNVKDFDLSMLKELDLVLDAGTLKGGPGSSVVDVTVNPPKIIRRGLSSLKKLSDHDIELSAIRDISEDFLSQEELNYYLNLEE
ncbi:L-threonylcarbamoyladenylate synthase [Candidatus Magnetomoraceae bacterium gMMP-13]